MNKNAHLDPTLHDQSQPQGSRTVSTTFQAGPSEPRHQDIQINPSFTIDYTYLGKLQEDLKAAKSTLLQKELELARLKSGSNDGHPITPGEATQNDALRQQLLAHSTSLVSLQSESSALSSLVNHLKSERDGLSKQREVLGKEIEARKAIQSVEGGGDPLSMDQNGQESPAGNGLGVERALLDMRGWMDQAIKAWDEVSFRYKTTDLADV